MLTKSQYFYKISRSLTRKKKGGNVRDSCEIKLSGLIFVVEFNWKMIVSTANKDQCVVCGTKSKIENTFILVIELIRVVNTETGIVGYQKPKAKKKIFRAMKQTEADKPHCEKCMKKRKFNPSFTMSHIWQGAWDHYCQAP